jgi:predicted phosphodiesterase
MKYLLMTDIHGKDLTNFQNVLQSINPDVLICNCDFDQVKSIRQYMEIKEDLLRNGKEVYNVPGNHDHSILNGDLIWSETLMKQKNKMGLSGLSVEEDKGKFSQLLHKELKKDKVAYDFIDNLVNHQFGKYASHKLALNLNPESSENKYKAIVIHGAYSGENSLSNNEDNTIKEMWNRLPSGLYHMFNFDKMREKGYSVMIRGHDHEPSYATTTKATKKSLPAPKGDAINFNDYYGNVDMMSGEGRIITLENDCLHTITPGAIADDYFAIIDTGSSKDNSTTPVLEFHNLKDWKISGETRIINPYD